MSVLDERRAARVTSNESAEIVGTPCVDGTALSASDVQRAAQKVAVQRERLRKAVYAVAGQVDDADECRQLFEIMGIDLASVRAARDARTPRSRLPESGGNRPLA